MRKTFDIKDKEVLDYLSKQPNQTYYIVNLIRNDMRKETIDKKTIIKIIEEYLKDKNIAKPKNEDIKNSVNGILNLIQRG